MIQLAFTGASNQAACSRSSGIEKPCKIAGSFAFLHIRIVPGWTDVRKVQTADMAENESWAGWTMGVF